LLLYGTCLQAQRINLYADPSGIEWVIGSTAGLVPVYVFAEPGPLNGLTAAQFRAAIPGCWTATVHLGDVWNFSAVIGNSQTGVSIGFGACYSNMVHLGTINLFSSMVPTGCCHYSVTADPLALTGLLEFVDCSATKYTREGYPAAWIGALNGDTSIDVLYPPNGATGLPLDTDISWSVSTCCITPRTVHTVRFGTTTDPPIVSVSVEHPTESYDPGPLLPNTTYYWKIFAGHGMCPGSSVSTPLLSFTTEQPVPVEHSTWGAIKALYR
jgi:hypothetical protein